MIDAALVHGALPRVPNTARTLMPLRAACVGSGRRRASLVQGKHARVLDRKARASCLWCAAACGWHACMWPQLGLHAQGEIECELPNASLYTFTGNLRLEGVLEASGQPATLPLSQASVLLRGCNLRNTGHIFGAVIFAGHETKVSAFGRICVQPAWVGQHSTLCRACGLCITLRWAHASSALEVILSLFQAETQRCSYPAAACTLGHPADSLCSPGCC